MIHVPFMTLPVPLSDELSRSCSPKNWWGSLREIKKKKKHQTIQLTPIAIKLILRISASGEIRRDNQLSVLEKKKKKNYTEITELIKFCAQKEIKEINWKSEIRSGNLDSNLRIPEHFHRIRVSYCQIPNRFFPSHRT